MLRGGGGLFACVYAKHTVSFYYLKYSWLSQQNELYLANDSWIQCLREVKVEATYNSLPQSLACNVVTCLQAELLGKQGHLLKTREPPHVRP